MKKIEAARSIHVGTFQLGWTNVDLYLDPDESGGCFYFAPNDKDTPRIRVGLDGMSWRDVVEVLLHETLELVLTRRDLRYVPTGRIACGHDSYVFHCDHNDFTQAVAEAAAFMVDTVPAVSKAYNGNKDRNKDRNKKRKKTCQKNKTKR